MRRWPAAAALAVKRTCADAAGVVRRSARRRRRRQSFAGRERVDEGAVDRPPGRERYRARRVRALNGPAGAVTATWGGETRLILCDRTEEIGLARDQMGLRVVALPAEIAVEADDARRRLVAPACIFELLGGKIERPSLIRDPLAVRIHDDRHRPLRRSLRNIVLDQLAHASVARGIRGPTEDHRDDVFLIAADR